MSQSLTPKITPATLGDVLRIGDTPGWWERVRNALPVLGMKARRNGTRIEACCRENWQPIMLPGGGVDFVNETVAQSALDLILSPEPLDTSYDDSDLDRIAKEIKEGREANADRENNVRP